MKSLIIAATPSEQYGWFMLPDFAISCGAFPTAAAAVAASRIVRLKTHTTLTFIRPKSKLFRLGFCLNRGEVNALHPSGDYNTYPMLKRF